MKTVRFVGGEELRDKDPSYYPHQGTFGKLIGQRQLTYDDRCYKVRWPKGALGHPWGENVQGENWYERKDLIILDEAEDTVE